MALIGLRLQQMVAAYILPYDQVAMREFADRPVGANAICKPIPTEVPANYGQAPFRAAMDTARNNPITRPGN